MADVDIDRLYQLPLADFTAARNELAGRAGGRKAEIKSLRKPNLGAWAVNQLYWRERPAYTRLTGAAERLRSAHARVLSGQKADVAAAEAEHAKALRAATDAVQGILTEAGETGSPTVLHEIRETLQALPSDEPPGRLTRPLKPMGFEALLKMLPGASAASTGRRTGPVEAPRPARTATTASRTTDAGDASSKRERAEQERATREEAKRIEAERKHQRGVLERELREARASERELTSTLSDAQDALARAEREVQRRQKVLDEQRFEVRKQAGNVAAQEQHLKAATDKRTEIERALGQLAKGQ
jgi:hypothetical protein